MKPLTQRGRMTFDEVSGKWADRKRRDDAPAFPEVVEAGAGDRIVPESPHLWRRGEGGGL